MKSFIWILPVILFIAVIAAGYALESTQNKTNNIIANNTVTNNESRIQTAADISTPNTKSEQINSTIGNNAG
jgi:hypothetical protein